MGMNFMLNNQDDLIKLLFDIDEFKGWEAVRVQLTSNLGANLTMNTKVNDPTGLYDYQLLKQVSSIVQSFVDENAHLTLNVDIKLRMPKKSKNLIDTKQEYKDFFLDFFSAGGTLTMISVSELEKSLDASIDVAANWRNYVQSIVDGWLSKNGYNDTSKS